MPVGRGMVEATGYLGGISFQFTGPLTRFEDVAVGSGNSEAKVSWRKARYRRVLEMHNTAIRRIIGLMTAERVVYGIQNMWLMREDMIALPETRQEALRNDGG